MSIEKTKGQKFGKKPFLFMHAKNRVLYPKETIPGLIKDSGTGQSAGTGILQCISDGRDIGGGFGSVRGRWGAATVLKSFGYIERVGSNKSGYWNAIK